MAIGDLIFIRSYSPLGRVIEAFDGYYSHCCVSLSPTNNIILESKGMMRSRVVPFYFHNTEYEIVKLGLNDDQKELALKVGVQLCGYRYDYWQIIGILLKDIFNFKKPYFMNNPNRFICSELTDLFLYGAGWLDDEDFLGDSTVNEFYRKVKSKLSENSL